MVVNILFYKHVSLFGKGGLVIDLIVINVSIMIKDFLFYFLLDYDFIAKKIKNYRLINEVKKVIYSGKIITFYSLMKLMLTIRTKNQTRSSKSNSIQVSKEWK
jgi:hypothetical protein